MKAHRPKSRIARLKVSKGPLSKHTYTVREIQDVLNISRGMSYELVNSGAFPVVRIGRTIRIPVKTFHEWLYNNNSAAS